MDNKILKRYMMLSFADDELREYLGKDIIKALIEWKNENELLFTKSRLSEMIISIYGLSLLKNQEFRRKLLREVEKEKIEKFKEVLPKKYANETDLEKLKIIISKQPWKPSPVTELFLEILGYKEEMVFNKEEAITCINQIKSYEKFYELLDYQYIIRQKALTRLTSGEELVRMLIHMPTGTGKTKTATHIVAHHYNYNLNKQGLVIWIAHTEELLEQAYETFEQVWRHIGNGEIKTYRLYGKFDIDKEEELNGFMICGIDKLESIYSKNKELFEKIKNNVRLIIYDEAHKASAPVSKKIIQELMIKKANMVDRALIGLSATPGRNGEISFDNDLLIEMFGGRKIKVEPELINKVNYSEEEALNMKYSKDIIKYFQERKVLSKLVKEELTYEEDISDNELTKIRDHITENEYEGDFSLKELEIIGRNRNRNLKILQRLIELNEENKPTIVFACSVRHAQLLSAMLKLHGIQNALVVGDMSPAERKNSISSFKDRENNVNIIINYGVLTTGFDSTNIECVFIARPTQSIVLYSQMIGRGLRGPKMGGNEECLLIDVKDNLNIYDEHMAFSKFDNYWKGL